jgi:hypothetical protein
MKLDLPSKGSQSATPSDGTPPLTHREGQALHYWETQSAALLFGLASTLCATIAGYKAGWTIGLWNGMIFCAAYLSWILFPLVTRMATAAPEPHRGMELRLMLPSLCMTIVGWGIAVTCRDTSVDSMSTHQDAVMALHCGWNPLMDPYFEDTSNALPKWGSEKVPGNVSNGITLSFAYIGYAIAAAFFGSHEAGKALQFLAFWLTFSIAMHVAIRLELRGLRRWAFATAAAGNPVLLLQLCSFYQDGILASLICGLLLLILSTLKSGADAPHLLRLGVIAAILSGIKLSGLGYGVILLGPSGLYWLITRKGKARTLILWGFATVALMMNCAQISRLWNFTPGFGDRLETKLEVYQGPSSDDPSTEESSQQLLPRSPVLQWANAAFGKTDAALPDGNWKSPFQIQPSEWLCLMNGCVDPRSGAYGPLYGSMFLLSLPLLIRLLWHPPVKSHAWAFFLLLFLLPLPFVPHYWLRWVPHGWLIPILGLLAKPDAPIVGKSLPLFQFASLIRRKYSWLMALLGTTTCLNIILTGSLSLASAWNSTRIIDRQLKLIRELPQPLTVFVSWSAATRFWILEEGFSFIRAYPTDLPSIRLYRSDTRVFLTDQDLEQKLKDGRCLKGHLERLRDEAARLQPGQYAGSILESPLSSDSTPMN